MLPLQSQNMKNTTRQICEVLEKPELLEWYEQLKNTNGSHIHEETTIEESYAEFVRLLKLIRGTAKSGLFDKIAMGKDKIFSNTSKTLMPI